MLFCGVTRRWVKDLWGSEDCWRQESQEERTHLHPHPNVRAVLGSASRSAL